MVVTAWVGGGGRGTERWHWQLEVRDAGRHPPGHSTVPNHKELSQPQMLAVSQGGETLEVSSVAFSSCTFSKVVCQFCVQGHLHLMRVSDQFHRKGDGGGWSLRGAGAWVGECPLPPSPISKDPCVCRELGAVGRHIC